MQRIWGWLTYFNPRTPVGCDQRCAVYSPAWSISIHAPQWGATCSPNAICWTQSFQSTHPSGVRHVDLFSSNVSLSFQSTHPSGVRPCPYTPRTPARHISIHAPQWGATSCDASVGRMRTLFQSTHPSGVRRAGLKFARRLDVISIHAPQWGATTRIRSPSSQRTDFNPRTPVGCDVRRAPFPPAHEISIHAPQWGATACV